MGEFVGRVFVRDADGGIGDPLEGVTIQFAGPASARVETGSGGTYLAQLPPGRYRVRATRSGFESATTTAILRGDRQTLNLFLTASEQRAESGIHGRVFLRNPDGSIGEEVAGASVAASRVGGARRTTTDASGRYRLKLPRGVHLVDARAPGVSPQQRRVRVRDGFSVVNFFLTGPTPRPAEPEPCGWVSSLDGEVRTSEVVVPGGGIAELTYQVVDGRAVLEGGIVLGDADDLAAEVARARRDPGGLDVTETPGVGVIRQPLVAQAGRDKLWEGATMPYQIAESSQQGRDRIEEAMDHISANTNIVFLPVTDDAADRVVFRFSDEPGVSNADLGRQGGVQEVRLDPSFGTGGIVHEILHALGVFHEQTRNDRDEFVSINWDDIRPGKSGNFRKAVARGGADIGTYDFASVMHYGSTTFGKDDPANPGSRLETITPRDPAISTNSFGSGGDSAPFLSAGDIAGLRALYPARREFDGGHLWGSGNYATGVALGDIDGDGRDELLVTRRASGNGRYHVFNDAVRGYRRIVTGGSSWGSGAYATCCALGDIDGDGRAELVVGRRAGENLRFQVSRITPPPAARWREDILFRGGEDWGDGAYTTDVAVGVDGSGTPLIGVARRSSTNARFFVYAGANDGFRLLFSGGRSWGSGNYATGIAFGDVDGDGRLELGVTRRAGGNARWFVLKDVAGDYTDFQTIHSGGVDWGSGNYATGIAFGDVDGDGRDEVAVARRAGENARYFVFGDRNENFALVESGGQQWGSGNYATAVALGDVDGDGRAGSPSPARPERTPASSSSTTRAATSGPSGRMGAAGARQLGDLGRLRGRVRVGRDRHIAVGRKAGENHRFAVHDYLP